MSIEQVEMSVIKLLLNRMLKRVGRLRCNLFNFEDRDVNTVRKHSWIFLCPKSAITDQER